LEFFCWGECGREDRRGPDYLIPVKFRIVRVVPALDFEFAFVPYVVDASTYAGEGKSGAVDFLHDLIGAMGLKIAEKVIEPVCL
jgi:hypothetical protein